MFINHSYTSSAFSCPFLIKRVGISLDWACCWDEWVWLWKSIFCPFDQNKNINITKSWSISYLVVGHSPDWIWWKAGVQGPCGHHDRWKEGLCDGPWWGNTGPEWPQGQYQSHCLQPDNRVIKLAVNYRTNPVMHHRSQKCQRTSGHTWHLPKHIR